MNKNNKKWDTSWFNTPFYHILYQERDDAEAHDFMDTLTSYLNIPERGTILDLACGRGRHARYLNKIGYRVTGVDLSENSINFAKQFENTDLHFEVHNICKPHHKQFDAVFNLFSSFGCFYLEEDNLNTIKAIKSNLNEFGFGVIDFMNSEFVIDNLVPEEIKTVNGIAFNMKRYVENGFIINDISFTTDGHDYKFQERIKALTLKDFEALFEVAQVHLFDVFGGYKLQKFNAKTSERLVMIFK